MRTNHQCERCQSRVRIALQADTHEPVLLDPSPAPTSHGFEVVHFDDGDAYVRPLSPGTTPRRGKGLAYHEHACLATLAQP